jgi:hypothetical protein
MPPQRLLIDDPEDKVSLALTKLIFDDLSSLISQHPIEAMEKVRLAQLQNANLVPLIRTSAMAAFCIELSPRALVSQD